MLLQSLGGGFDLSACCGNVEEGDVLWHTIKEAGTITSCAMVTTAVAFGASINSPISTIRQYALFQTVCVGVEWLLILMLFLPGMVTTRKSLFLVRNGVTARSSRLIRCLHKYFAKPLSYLLLPLRILLSPSTPDFWRRLTPCMRRGRYPLVLLWMAVVGVQSYFATQLTPGVPHQTSLTKIIMWSAHSI